MIKACFRWQALIAATATLGAIAVPAKAGTLTSELLVPGGGSVTAGSNSATPGFSPVLNQNLRSDGVAITSSLNLASGSLRGTINSVGSQKGGTFNLAITEQIFLSIPGAVSSTMTTIGFRQYFSADLAVTDRSSVTLDTRFYSADGAIASAFVSLTSADFRPFHAYGNGYNFADLPVTRGSLGVLSGTFDHTTYFNVRGPSPELFMAVNVQGIGGRNSWVGFGNSAHLGFVLPDGVTFTSASGSALTQSAFPGPGVPEPASWAMLIAGFGLVGAANRRRMRPNGLHQHCR